MEIHERMTERVVGLEPGEISGYGRAKIGLGTH